MDGTTLLVVVGIAGVCGGLVNFVRTWSIHSRLYSLEDAVSVLQGVQTREVKIRASSERPRKLTAMEERISGAMETPAVQPEPKRNWWEKAIGDRSLNR